VSGEPRSREPVRPGEAPRVRSEEAQRVEPEEAQRVEPEAQRVGPEAQRVEPEAQRVGPEEALRRLEERLDRASAAAERLMAEAMRAPGAAGATERARCAGREPPPAGWQAPGSESAGSEGDLDALVLLLRSLRDLIPRELQRRLIKALREVLQAIRALIDWYLERLEQSRPEPAEVQDIPIL
jgi:hypothetical protein